MKRLIKTSARLVKQSLAARGPKVAFIHIPKCGGSSLKNALGRKLDPLSRYTFKYEQAHESARLTSNKTFLNTNVVDDFEQLKFLLCYHLNGDYRFVHGHFPVTDKILQHYIVRYQFVTMMRDPQDRWKSNYLFNKGLPDPDSRRLPSKNFDGTLEDEFSHVIESGMGLLMGTTTTAFLSGRYPVDQHDAITLGEQATKNLTLFSAVGKLENLDAFSQQLTHVTGKTLSVGTQNKTVALYTGQALDAYERTREFLNSESIANEIKALVKADKALYDSID